jgi:Rv2525c-like, glycoside hydrolase-like domain
MKAIDTPYSTLGKAHEIAAAGYGAVLRYISPDTANFPEKQLTHEEAHNLHLVGLKIGVVYEKQATLASLVGNGVVHAQAAVAAARAAGQPGNLASAIAFAVDFDSGLTPELQAYATSFHDYCKGHGYLTTCYGSGTLIAALKALGLIHYRWLAGAPGWSGYVEQGAWEIRQLPTDTHYTVAGLDVDENIVTGPAGLW